MRLPRLSRCVLCRVVDAAKRVGVLDEVGDCDDATMDALKAARAGALKRGIDLVDVDEATFEGLDRALDPDAY